ncbi:hypothetical protein KSP40_PGU021978 [Platanthera guangdongensis]|uniref:RCD1 WWE domain-containing protein n=1 Tax=Platanthera guangdongensis TaxID=2320717 RepID=A0ABR2LE22_9ASPA
MTGAGNPPPDSFPVQNLNLACGFFSADQMLRAFSNFKKSGAPSRFLLFSDDAWVDFARQVFDELKSGFLAGKATLEVTTIDRKAYLFDFLRMVRIDSDTGKKNSIAWIDVHGRCFFPSGLDDRGDPSQENLEFRLRMDNNLLLMPSPSHSPPELCDESMEVSSDRWPGAKLLRNDEKSYRVAEQLFLSGITRFIPNVVISSIHSREEINDIGSWWKCECEVRMVRRRICRQDCWDHVAWLRASQ